MDKKEKEDSIFTELLLKNYVKINARKQEKKQKKNPHRFHVRQMRVSVSSLEVFFFDSTGQTMEKRRQEGTIYR